MLILAKIIIEGIDRSDVAKVPTYLYLLNRVLMIDDSLNKYNMQNYYNNNTQCQRFKWLFNCNQHTIDKDKNQNTYI